MPDQLESQEIEDSTVHKRDLSLELVSVYQRLGRPPTVEEVEEYGEYPYKDYRTAFGDLFTALKQAGILDDSATRSEYLELADIDREPRSAGGSSDTTAHSDSEVSQESPPRSKLLEELNRIAASLDRIPYSSDMDEAGAFSAYAYREEFGSWDAALEAAGINKETALLKDMQRVVDMTGTEPTQQAMNAHGKYSASMAARFFGSWSSAKERFEQWSSTYIGTTTTDDSTDEQTGSGENESPSRRTLLDDLQRLDESLDRIPYATDTNRDGKFTLNAYLDEFGSWDAALEAAGIDKEAELMREFQRVTETLGKTPSQTEMSNHGTYSFGIYADFFGSWSAAKERFDEWRETDRRSGTSAASTDCEVQQEATIPDENKPETDAADDDTSDAGQRTEATGNNREIVSGPESLAGLTNFQRDLLYVTAGIGPASGLAIKEDLEDYYEKEIHHGRLYPNLDTLVDEELIHKEAVDERTNGYSLTPTGRSVLNARRVWEHAQLEARIREFDGSDREQITRQPSTLSEDRSVTTPVTSSSAEHSESKTEDDVPLSEINSDITRIIDELLSTEEESSTSDGQE